MPRPRKDRRCREYRGARIFKPIGIPMRELDITELELDELEAMRLCDLEGLDQRGAGERMGVSRTTVQRLLASGRAKLLGSLLDSSAVRIAQDP